MRKFSIAVAAVALAVGVTVAQATPNPHSLGPHGKSGLHPNKGKATLHCTHTVGGYIRGTYVSANPLTLNLDGTYSGTIDLTNTKVSKNATRAGVTEPVTADNNKIVFDIANGANPAGAANPAINFEDATPNNTVVMVLLKITKTRTSGKCGTLNLNKASASRATFDYSLKSIKRIIVHPPDTDGVTDGASGASGTT